MKSLWFWNTWLKAYRLIWYGLLGIFLFSFAMLWFSYFKGAESVIDWNTIQEQKVLESTVHTFQVGSFQLEIPADSYVILEYFNGGSIHLNTFGSGSFIVVLILAV